MIFESLFQSAEQGELILLEGAMCRWHLREDGQITIREILVLPEYRRRGLGRLMLKRLLSVPGAKSIFAKCPIDLPANAWYERVGFDFDGDEVIPSGRTLRRWRYTIVPDILLCQWKP